MAGEHPAMADASVSEAIPTLFDGDPLIWINGEETRVRLIVCRVCLRSVTLRQGGRLLRPVTMLAVSLAASNALAADPANGRLLAASYCAVCHAVAPPQRNDVAAAPTFEMIARKYGSNEAALVLAILAPHPRMNFVPQRPHAEDIAAYIATLPR